MSSGTTRTVQPDMFRARRRLTAMVAGAVVVVVTICLSPLSSTAVSRGAQPARHPSPVPTTTTTTTAPPAASGGRTFGLSLPTLITLTPAAQATLLATAKSTGITSIRVEANWAWVQYGGPTSYDWSQLDPEISSIRAAGLAVDLVIDGCPTWAALPAAAGQLFAQPASSAAYASWAATVVGRYAPEGVTTYEIWNEPNSAEFWQPEPNPAAYTADLKAAYASIKAVDRSAFVVSGGLAPEANDGSDINGVTFLADMYADGAKGSFDALGYHPYSYPALPNTFQSWSAWSQMAQTSPSIESVMAANRDSSKQLWLTEVGAPSSGPDGVGLAAQATELTQVIADAKSTSWIGAVFIYTLQDSGTDPSTDEDWFGLLTAAGTPKPSFAAVQSALT